MYIECQFCGNEEDVEPSDNPMCRICKKPMTEDDIDG